MPAGFSPSLAFGSGLASGIETAQAAKDANQFKIDDEFRKRALQLNYETELYNAKKNRDEQDAQQSYSQVAAAAGLNKQNTTNQATFDAIKQAQMNPPITQATGSPPPTNTPQTAVTPQNTPPAAGAAPVQSGQIQQQNLPPPGQPQPAPLPNSQPMDPQQGDNTNPFKSPAQQQNDNVNPSGGDVMPNNNDDLITDSFGNKLTRQQAARAVSYGVEENAKLKGVLPPDVAYNIGIGKVMKEDGELGDGTNNTGINKYGFKIGLTPEGLSAPVLPEKFDETRHMTPAQAGKKIQYDDQQLAKDKEAANTAMKASQEFSMYLAGNDKGDTGGLNKIGFIRDFTSAMGSTDGTLDSINKSLTFNIVGFERTPGMRLTQAEFFIAREAMPGRGNTPEANENIARFWQAKLSLPQEWAQFKQDYMTANGTWNEAIGSRMFQQYQKDNPIFDPAVMNHPEKAHLSDFKINENRQTLEQYAKSGGFSKLGFLGLQAPPAQQQAPQQQSQPQGNGARKDPMGLFSE